MKIRIYPADLAGCGHYRMIFPGNAVRSLGHDVSIHTDGILMENATFAHPPNKGPGPWTMIGGEVPDADVVVIQRPTHPGLAAAIEYMVKAGIRVIVDIDDRFDAVPRANMAWDHYKNPEAIRALGRSLKAASVVTCSTKDLAHLHNGILLENCIPESYLAIPDQHDDVVGWAGTLSVHRNDLKVVGGGVHRALSNSTWAFRVVGESAGVGGELGLSADPEQTGWLPVEEYPAHVARLGIGIAPLEDNLFNRAKSWLKPLEYAALGVPFVATSLPEYERLGVGLLASSPRQWKGLLSALLNDPVMRDDLRLAGRACARKWTFEENATKWAEIWIG
jgi:glycosyltransferase involved in cell wall biosynthesis